MDLPVKFEALARAANTPVSGAYPYSLKGSDLDKNFVFATLVVDESLIEETTGQGGHPARRLGIPAVPSSGTKSLTADGGSLEWADTIPKPPSSGTHVLGAVNGALAWIATEEC